MTPIMSGCSSGQAKNAFGGDIRQSVSILRDVMQNDDVCFWPISNGGIGLQRKELSDWSSWTIMWYSMTFVQPHHDAACYDYCHI
jgi:hypothetical protein